MSNELGAEWECVEQNPNRLYCIECKSLCSFYDQGLCCDCGRHWETEVLDPDDWPEKWVKVTVQIWRNKR